LIPDAGLSTLWASGPSDVFAGSGGQIWHFDGNAWTPETSDPIDVTSLWGTGPSDVFAGARFASERLLHFDGAQWSAVRLPALMDYADIAGEAITVFFATPTMTALIRTDFAP